MLGTWKQLLGLISPRFCGLHDDCYGSINEFNDILMGYDGEMGTEYGPGLGLGITTHGAPFWAVRLGGKSGSSFELHLIASR